MKEGGYIFLSQAVVSRFVLQRCEESYLDAVDRSGKLSLNSYHGAFSDLQIFRNSDS